MPLHHVPLKVTSAKADTISERMSVLPAKLAFGRILKLGPPAGAFTQTAMVSERMHSLGTVLPATGSRLV